jgi:hypothetical protein
MDSETVAAWAQDKTFEPLHVDCATSLMLKILDGKCKMNDNEKQVMAVIYDVVKHKPGKLLEPSVHQLIALARSEASEQLIEQVYEQRLYAEQMISRPVMKAYKAMMRQEGIL